MSILIITEKPSVAMSYARVLIKKAVRKDGYLEGISAVDDDTNLIVSWCVGHLVTPAAPDAYDRKYAKWRKEDLPIVPDKWKYEVIETTKKQFAILKMLMNRNDVESLVEATDAGREGENIFRLVYEKAGCRKPFRRLWLSSMEDSAILEGFRNLKPSGDYDLLYSAALCRERADWIVGMNATRLFSCLYGQTLNVGRVMSPTFAMIAEREAARKDFRPEPYYTVELKFPEMKAVSQKFKTREEAEQLLSKCLREELTAVVSSVTSKDKTEKAPLLYDLTTLQRDANRRYGYSAQETLDYTQALYEKKMVTYPRTDSQYLTDDMEVMLPDLVRKSGEAFGWVKGLSAQTERALNSEKVTDHHAIIPTVSMAKAELNKLPEPELKILWLIVERLLEAVSVSYRYKETVLELMCGGSTFTAKGKTVLEKGWKEIADFFSREKNTKPAALPDLKTGMTIRAEGSEIKEGFTQAPASYTEDTLLRAMETAGKEDMPEEAERQGIGTPATRSGIIEKLIRIGFVERSGKGKTKSLIPTEKGKQMAAALPEALRSPLMTAQWEQELLKVENGSMPADQFMADIRQMTEKLVHFYEKREDVCFPAESGRQPRKGRRYRR